MKFWIKYIALGLSLALLYLLLWSNSQASVDLRQWLAGRLLLQSPAMTVQSEPVKTETPASFADAISRSAPAVVSIQTVSKGTLSKNPNPTSVEDRYLVNVGVNIGSGVIIDSRGYVVTNYHVIHEAESIKVQLSDGRQKIATVIGSDPMTDLSLLHIDLENLPTALSNSEREVRAGDVVFAIGNPYGQFDQTVTMGIISATRSTRSDLPIYQIDAAIHPGNSGGALVNAHGELIGITTQQLAAKNQGAAQTGISFTIPFPVVQDIVKDLMDDGKVSRGWLGFSANPVNQRGHKLLAPDHIQHGQGFAITEVNPEGPADQAGLQYGDFVTHINGELISSFKQVYNITSESKPGDTVEFKFYREKQLMTVSLTVGEAPVSL